MGVDVGDYIQDIEELRRLVGVVFFVVVVCVCVCCLTSAEATYGLLGTGAGECRPLVYLCQVLIEVHVSVREE